MPQIVEILPALARVRNLVRSCESGAKPFLVADGLLIRKRYERPGVARLYPVQHRGAVNFLEPEIGIVGL
jgi:hypothetical protein